MRKQAQVTHKPRGLSQKWQETNPAPRQAAFAQAPPPLGGSSAKPRPTPPPLPANGRRPSRSEAAIGRGGAAEGAESGRAAAPRLLALSRRQKSAVMPVLAALLRRGAAGAASCFRGGCRWEGLGLASWGLAAAARPGAGASVRAFGKTSPPHRTLRSRPEAQAPGQRFHSPRPCRSVGVGF